MLTHELSIDTANWRPWRRYLCVGYRHGASPPQTLAVLLARMRTWDAYVVGNPGTWWYSEEGARRRCAEQPRITYKQIWVRTVLEVSRDEIALAELAEVR